MAEVLLDAKFWNKVFKLLKPATVVAVKKNKGSAKGKLIPSNYSLNLNTRLDNKVGFILRCMTENIGLGLPSYYSEKGKLSVAQKQALNEGITGNEIKEIEKAIIKVAIHEGILPATALYEGEHVVTQIEQRSAPEPTDAFGFVYFIRNSDIYKLRITDNLLRRMKELKPDEILNSVRCSNYQEIEKKMHAHFKEKRIPQTEYFRLDPAEVEEAHALMTDLADFKGR